MQWMPRGLGMFPGHSKTFFLCVPKYIPTEYNTIHTAIVIFGALTDQSTLPRCLLESDRIPLCTCLPESDRVPMCTRPADNARGPPYPFCIYKLVDIQQTNNAPDYLQYYYTLYEVQ